MKTVSFTEFRKNASSYLDLVEKGGEVDIERHGRLVARLVPSGTRDQPAWKRPGLRLAIKGQSLSKAVIENRR